MKSICDNIQSKEHHLQSSTSMMISTQQHYGQANMQHGLIRIHNYVYNTNHLLGAGNFSKVYAGTQINTGERVALKIIELSSLNDPKLVELHQLQMDILSKLNHPNVLRCYEIINLQTQCLIVTEICDQGDLNMLVKRQGVLSEERAAFILRDILEGLLYISTLNIIHRDLKTANILLDKGRAKIADFGLATYAKQNFRDLSIGSPMNMAPEGFLDCIYGPKTDVWSFGILVYEILHGDSPYSSCKLQKDLLYQLSLPFNKTKIRPTLKMELKEMICMCLQVNQSKRISMAELKETNYFRKIYFELSHQGMTYHGNMQQNNGIKHSNMQLHENRQPDRMQQDKQLYHGPPNQYITTINNQHQESIDNHHFPVLQINSNSKQGPGRAFDFMVNQEPIINKKSPEKVSSKDIPLNMSQKKYAKPPKNRDIIRLGRPMSNDKGLTPRNNLKRGQIQRQRMKTIDRRKPQENYIIFTLPINLKITVNLINYCRCLFMCINSLHGHQSRGEQQSLQYMTGWLILILQEINKKMNNKQIIFEGQKADFQAQKVRDVRNEYQRRYTNSLKKYIKKFINKPSLEQIKSFFCQKYLTLDKTITQQKSKSLLELGHLIIILYDSTRLMKRCKQEDNYTIFMNYKHLGSILNWQKEQFTYSSYLGFKSMMTNR